MFWRKSKNPAAPQPPDLNGQLLIAAAAGDVKETARLLDLGADANCSAAGGDTPLFKAAWSGGDEGHHQVIKLLLSRGANVNLANANGCTALTAAAQKGHLASLKTLLAAGADREHRGLGKTALAWALEGGQPNAVVLLQQAPPEPPAPRAESPDEVVFRSALSNRALEEIFNFEKKERITLIRKSADGPVEAVTRDGFSKIEDKADLERAFAQYAARGGRRGRDEIFPDQLSKLKPVPKEPAA